MKRECIKCGEEFVLTPNKPGKINECQDCARDMTIRYVACVAFDGKTHGKIEITKDTQYATAFNKAQQRRGYGVVGGMVERKSGKLSTQSRGKIRTATTGKVIGGVAISSKNRSDIQETYTRR